VVAHRDGVPETPASQNVPMTGSRGPSVRITFAGSGDAFGSGGRYQACIHVRPHGTDPLLLDCGATSLSALKRLGLDPGEIGAVLVSHLHGDHFGGLPFLILDGQFAGRTKALVVAGPPGTAERLTVAMECMFPGSSNAARRFEVEVVELCPGSTTDVAGVDVSSWEVDHPSGAPPLALRLVVAGTVIAYTGDTAWTDSVVDAAAGADLLIAEAYFRDKAVPYHLRLCDLTDQRLRLEASRVVVTHMSPDVLDHPADIEFEAAHDGLVLEI
jgi:ribonuclease BN (tRNA processing enzyme)